MQDCSHDYLLNKQVSIFQPLNGYRASTDAVFLASVPAKIKSGDSFLDIGSGTGAISLCLAARLQEYAPRITGLELQPELVELSNRSAEANGFARVNFRHCNIKELPADIPFCSFDHVISNPPYAEEDMPSPNPGKALAHNHQDFTLKEWVKFAIKMLKPRGRFYMINRAAALFWPHYTASPAKSALSRCFPKPDKPRPNGLSSPPAKTAGPARPCCAALPSIIRTARTPRRRFAFFVKDRDFLTVKRF